MQIGLGSSVGSISTAISSEGGSERTDNAFDLKIGGSSFFIESMRQASESVSPKVRQAFDTMQERIKKQSDEPDDETAPSVEPSATKNNEER